MLKYVVTRPPQATLMYNYDKRLQNASLPLLFCALAYKLTYYVTEVKLFQETRGTHTPTPTPAK